MKTIRLFVIILISLVSTTAFYSCEKNNPTDSYAELSFRLNNSFNTQKENNKKEGVEGENPGVYPTCTKDKVSFVIAMIDGKTYVIYMTALPKSQTEVIQLDTDKSNILESLVAYNSDGIPIYQMPKNSSPEVLKGKLKGVPMPLELRPFVKSRINVDLLCWNKYSHIDPRMNY